MINKLRLQYYKLLIKYYSFFTYYVKFNIKFGIFNMKYPTPNTKNRQKAIHYSTLYIDLHYDVYPQKHTTVECLDTCGLTPFEEATINLRNEQTETKKAYVNIVTYF